VTGVGVPVPTPTQQPAGALQTLLLFARGKGQDLQVTGKANTPDMMAAASPGP